MRIFLSYASEDRHIAEAINLALTGQSHDVFFDRASLLPAGDYHERIREAISRTDLVIFLITSRSVATGSYALSELAHAQARWKHPKNHLLPVRLEDLPLETIPAYLKAVTLLEPIGNVEAEVLGAVSRLESSLAQEQASSDNTTDRDRSTSASMGFGKILDKGALARMVSRRTALWATGPLLGTAAGFVVGAKTEEAVQRSDNPSIATAPAQEPSGSFEREALKHQYLIQSVHYMCHLQKGKPGPSGVWGGPGSNLLSRIHITYTYRANRDLDETDEQFQTQMSGARLRGFFSTIVVAGQSEPPSSQQVAVKLAFPMRTGDIKTYATGVDIEYQLPLESKREMDHVDVNGRQYFIHYPNKYDYIKHATMTIESNEFGLQGGQFSTRKKGGQTATTTLLAQSPCQDACGTNVWHAVVTASLDDILPGADFGLRVTWA